MEPEELVVELSGWLMDCTEVVATVVLLPAASLTTGVKVKLSSFALPSETSTLLTVTDMYLYSERSTC